MELRTVAHKGLRRLIEDGSAAGLPAAYVEKIEAILSFLSVAPRIEAVQKLTVWRAHQLAGQLVTAHALGFLILGMGNAGIRMGGADRAAITRHAEMLLALAGFPALAAGVDAEFSR